MARRYDVTLPLRADIPTYPGEPGPRREDLARIDRGDPANVGALSLGLHTGTHVDAPIHFLPGGTGVDQLPLDALIGPATLVEIDADRLVGAADLDRHLAGHPADRVLLKTRNSSVWSSRPTKFLRDYVALGLDGAEWLIERGARLIGIDYLSIEGFDAPGHPVHRLLLGAGVVILEGVDLSAVPPGRYDLACLPLLIPGADGAPARVVLTADDGR